MLITKPWTYLSTSWIRWDLSVTFPRYSLLDVICLVGGPEPQLYILRWHIPLIGIWIFRLSLIYLIWYTPAVSTNVLHPFWFLLSGLVQAVESYRLWPEGLGFESRSPRIAQTKVRLATDTLPQTPHRAGALCTGYALIYLALEPSVFFWNFPLFYLIWILSIWNRRLKYLKLRIAYGNYSRR